MVENISLSHCKLGNGRIFEGCGVGFKFQNVCFWERVEPPSIPAALSMGKLEREGFHCNCVCSAVKPGVNTARDPREKLSLWTEIGSDLRVLIKTVAN